jgi:DNA-binding transcriptional MerR regulator
MTDHYSISQLAKEFDVTTRTIRFYEEKGFLNPERKGTTRIYSPQDKTTLELILRGKNLGFSLEESAQILAIYNHDSAEPDQLQQLLTAISEKRAQLQRQQKNLSAMLNDLDAAEKHCQQALTDNN